MHQNQVREFREAFNLPINEKPTMLYADEYQLHRSLLLEEISELEGALFFQNVQETYDAIIDIQYVLWGLATHMGLDVAPGFDEVHRSNMSKLDENGEPIYHDGTTGPKGKVAKSAQYFPPALDVVLEEQSE